MLLYFGRAVVMVVFWPFLSLFRKFLSQWKLSIANAPDKIKMQAKTNEDLVVSARAQIIEVAIESSFQPLLQLYLLLPFLIKRFGCFLKIQNLASLTLDDLFGTLQRIQFWSVFTSIISLAWSFTYYQSIKKRGALDFGANAVGRILLLLANFLQICSRLIALVLCAYCFGPGNFWPMIVSVAIHILVMSILHYVTVSENNFDGNEKDGKNSKSKETETSCMDGIKTVYHCFINGVCNLYLHMEIMKISSENELSNHRGTLSRQVIFDMIFFLENAFIVCMSYIALPTDLPIQLLIFIMISQVSGFVMKWIYYYYFHIWKAVIDFPCRQAITAMEQACQCCKPTGNISQETGSNEQSPSIPMQEKPEDQRHDGHHEDNCANEQQVMPGHDALGVDVAVHTKPELVVDEVKIKNPETGTTQQNIVVEHKQQ